jgi:hypothetical protein
MAHALDLIRRGRGAKDRGAGDVGELHGSSSDPRGSSVNEDGFAHAQVSLGEEGVMRSDEHFRHGGGLGPIELARDLRERAFRYDNQFGLRTPGGDSKNTLAHFPRAHFFADGFDFTGKLEARNVLRKTGRRGIFSLALNNVGADSVPPRARALARDRPWGS